MRGASHLPPISPLSPYPLSPTPLLFPPSPYPPLLTSLHPSPLLPIPSLCDLHTGHFGHVLCTASCAGQSDWPLRLIVNQSDCPFLIVMEQTSRSMNNLMIGALWGSLWGPSVVFVCIWGGPHPSYGLHCPRVSSYADKHGDKVPACAENREPRTIPKLLQMI